MTAKRMVRHRRLFVALALSLGTTACENALSPYRGPQPSTEDIAGEVGVIRYVWTEETASFVLDRTRFAEAGKPHDVNRVVWLLTTDAMAARVDALQLQPGDTVLISTAYAGVTEVGELTRIPNWPGHEYGEYPIGVHRFVEVDRLP